MSVYNLTKIENWYDDFLSYQSKFKNTYYEDYKSSYIMRYSSDAIIAKMKKELSSSYNRIDKIYKNIDKFWKEFLEDVEITDLVLANERKSSSINASSVAAKLSKLPQLDEYTATAGIVLDYHGASKTIDSIKYWFEENISWESVGATVGTFVVSLSEGVVNLGEAAVDLTAIIGAIGCTLAVGFATSNLPTYAQQQVNLTGEGSIINQIWEETRAFVSTDYSTIWYDDFYNTDGAWLKENAIGFDVVRSAGSEIGQVACVVALSAVTGGSAAVIYGASKTAQHTERNWQDENVGTFEGLIKGAAQGTADGVFFAVGMKGDKAVKSFVSKGSYNALQKGGILAGKMLFEGGTSVAQDGTNVFIDTLFLDNKITNSDGTITTFNSFSEKLNYCYNQAGGDDMLKSSLVSAIVLSGLSDRSDVYDFNIVRNAMGNAKKTVSNVISKSPNLEFSVEYLKSNLRKYVYKDTNLVEGLNQEIKNNGLYHFTNATDEILNSGYIKASNINTSYGNPKTFFFNGVPSIGQVATNLNDIPVKATAIKVEPSDAIISGKKLKIRSIDDKVISYDGKFNLGGSNATKQYLCLFLEEGKLVYKTVSKEVYDSYDQTDIGKQLSDFVGNKKNAQALKINYFKSVSKNNISINQTDEVLDFSYSDINKSADSSTIIDFNNSSLVNDDLFLFSKMTAEQKVDFLENSHIITIGKLLMYEKNFAFEYSDILEKRILENQDLISFKLFTEEGYFSDYRYYSELVSYIENNEKILTNLSNENLVFIYGKSNNQGKILEILKKRIDSGDIIFNNNNVKDDFKLKGYSYSNRVFNDLPKEYQNKIIKSAQQLWNDVPQELKDLEYNMFFSQAGVAKMYREGRLSEKSIKLMQEISNENSNGLSRFNIGLFDKEIVDSLDNNFIKEIGNHIEISEKVVQLYKNNEKLFKAFSETINLSMKDNSLNTLYIKSESYLKYLYDNSKLLKNVDASILKNEDFINYVLYNQNTYSIRQNGKKIHLDYSLDYNKKFALKCNNMFEEAINNKDLIQAKEAYFQKYFSLSYDEVQKFISKYGEHISEVVKYDNDNVATITMQLFKKIDETYDFEYLKKVYDSQKFNMSAEEMIHIDSKIKELYSQTYIEKLNMTNNNISKALSNPSEIINYNGKAVKIIDINDDFSFLVHSSDTGFTMNKVLVNDSYVDTWKNISPETHGLSTSYITQSNIGSAPVKNKGVLYAFNNLSSKDIGIMAPYDVNAHVDLFGFDAGNKQIFMSADEMTNSTYRVYNEVVLDRKNVKPDYVIVYKDMPKESIDSAIKAASEWDIPVIRIDKVDLAKQQLNQINNLVDNFKTTKNMESLEKALDMYESNVSGFKLNSYVVEGKRDPTSSIDNSIVSDIFRNEDIENKLLDVIDNIDDEKQIVSLIEKMKKIQMKYNLVNKEGTFVIANTRESFDINTLIDIAIEKVKGA